DFATDRAPSKRLNSWDRRLSAQRVLTLTLEVISVLMGISHWGLQSETRSAAGLHEAHQLRATPSGSSSRQHQGSHYYSLTPLLTLLAWRSAMADEADCGTARRNDRHGCGYSGDACLDAGEYDRRAEGSRKGAVKVA